MVRDRMSLLLITNRKLHMGFRLVLTSMTLNDLERRYFAFFHRIRQIFFQADYITVVELTYNVRKILPLFAKTITHPAAWSLCDS